MAHSELWGQYSSVIPSRHHSIRFISDEYNFDPSDQTKKFFLSANSDSSSNNNTKIYPHLEAFQTLWCDSLRFCDVEESWVDLVGASVDVTSVEIIIRTNGREYWD